MYLGQSNHQSQKSGIKIIFKPKNLFQVEEKLHKEKQMLREAINTESLEVNKRVDKVNIDRMNDVADVQAKVFTSIIFVPTLGIGRQKSRHCIRLD